MGLPICQQKLMMQLGTELQRRAKHDSLERAPITGQLLRNSLGKKGAAQGIDSTNGLLLRELPAEAFDELAALCSAWEAQCALPLQVLISVMAVLPKPQGGERLIALMHMILRSYVGARLWTINEWEDSRGHWWDTALRGCSALRAAALRSFGAELAVLAGASTAGGFIDIAKFYDSLDPVILMRQLMDLEFPSLSLLLHLQAHWGWRCILHSGVAGDLVGVSRSILAGCTSSNSIARAYLHHVCQELSWQLPRLRISTFVDDFVLWLVASPRGLVHDMREAVCKAYELIDRAGLDISDKSVLVASRVDVARRISAACSSYGVRIAVASQAKDLGVGSGMGGRRACHTMINRRKKGQLRLRRALVIKSALKGKGVLPATKLWRTSLEPAMLYGASVAGLAHNELEHVRSIALASTGMQGKHQSKTAAIAVVLGQDADPGIRLRIDIVLQWLEIAQAHAPSFPGLSTFWAKGVTTLQCSSEPKSQPTTVDRDQQIQESRHDSGGPQPPRWAQVKGPMLATIAVLLDAKWVPVDWSRWQDPRGCCWQVVPGVVCNQKTCGLMLRAMRDDVRQQLWASSSVAAFLPEGQVPWIAGVRKTWLQLQKDGKHDEATMLIRVFAGGLWPKARAHKEMPLRCPSPVCRLCGHAIQDEWHTAYECPSVLAHPLVAPIADLVEQAHRGNGQALAFWSRGYATDIYNDIPPPTSIPDIRGWPSSTWAPAVYYTDASGGRHAADPLLRRVGCGAVRVGDVVNASGRLDPQILAYMEAALPDMTQTVNRGELYSIIQVLKRVLPDSSSITTIVTDSQYCVNGFAAGRKAQEIAWNDDLWSDFFDEVDRHGGKVFLRKVASHLELRDVVQGVILLVDLAGNALADSAAGACADRMALLDQQVESVQAHKGKTLKVLRHVVAANLANVRLLAELPEEEDHASPGKPEPKKKTSAKDRGHDLVRVGCRWQCRLCLLCRASTRGAAWPMLCRGHPKAPWQSHWRQRRRSAAVQDGPAPPLASRRGALDDADGEDPMEVLEMLHAADGGIEAEAAPLAVPAGPRPLVVQWMWGQLPESMSLEAEHLRVGNTLVHASHVLATFGNEGHCIVLCGHCMGLTSGAFSPLLSGVCRRRMGSTRSEQLTRMLRRSLWPHGQQQRNYGQGSLSEPFVFAPIAPHLGLLHRAKFAVALGPGL